MARQLSGLLGWLTPAERYNGTPFTDRAFESIPALAHLQGWLKEVIDAAQASLRSIQEFHLEPRSARAWTAAPRRQILSAAPSPAAPVGVPTLAQDLGRVSSTPLNTSL